MGRVVPHYSPEHDNPMAGDDEIRSPLKKYEHLLPSSSHSINSLDQHLFMGTGHLPFKVFGKEVAYTFLVNVSILYAAEDAQTLRVTIARTEDRAVNPSTGETEQRDLFYAALVLVQPHNDTQEMVGVSPTRALARGPAVPYFAPPPEAVKGGNNNGKANFSFSSARYVNEEREVRDAKEKAFSLLMARMETMVHERLLGKDGEVEIWSAKSWKHSESSAPDREGSVMSAKGRHGGSGWFSKSFDSKVQAES